MIRLKLLLLGCVALTWVACQDTSGSNSCPGGKCDGFGEGGIAQIMPRAPQVSGTTNITRSADGWFFEVVGAKGNIELFSESYASRANALGGMLSAEENGVLAERYSVEPDTGGFVAVLKAGNGQVLATSRTFAGESAAEDAADRSRNLVADIVQYKAALQHGAKFTLDRASTSSAWQFELVDEQGEPLLQSQSYSGRRDAITGIESVRSNGKDAGRYELQTSPPKFILKAGNNREIASSLTFDSLAAAEAAMNETQTLLTSERIANPW